MSTQYAVRSTRYAVPTEPGYYPSWVGVAIQLYPIAEYRTMARLGRMTQWGQIVGLGWLFLLLGSNVTLRKTWAWDSATKSSPVNLPMN